MLTAGSLLVALSWAQGLLLVGVAAVCAWTDARGGRIANRVVLAGVLGGAALSYLRGGVWAGGWSEPALATSLACGGAAFALFLFFYWSGGTGAGDAKLAAALGALAATPKLGLWILSLTALAGMPLALFVLRRKGDVVGGLARGARSLFRWKYGPPRTETAADGSAPAASATGDSAQPASTAVAAVEADATPNAAAAGEAVPAPQPDTIPYAVAMAAGVLLALILLGRRGQLPVF